METSYTHPQDSDTQNSSVAFEHVMSGWTYSDDVCVLKPRTGH